MTEPLFRFLVLRPPVKGDTERPPIVLAQESDLQKALKKGATSDTPKKSLQTAAKNFLAIDKAIKSPDRSDFQKKLVQFTTLVNVLENAQVVQLDAVINAVKHAFGKEASEVVEEKEFFDLKTQLKDSIVAIKYVQESHSLPFDALVDQLRDIELIERAASIATSSSPQPRAAEGSETTRATEPKWVPDKNYNVGDRVRFQEIIYQCIQAHRSQADWEPRLTPALWKAVVAVEPEVPDVDVPLYRKRSLLLPLELDLKSALATSAGQKSDQGGENPETPAEKEEKSAQELLDKYDRLNIAISELVKLDPSHFQVEIPANHDGVGVDPKFTRSTVLGDQLEFRSSLRKVALTRSSLSPGSGGPSIALADAGTLADEPSKPSAPIQTEPTGAFTLASV